MSRPIYARVLRLKLELRRFARDCHGGALVEFAVTLPLMIFMVAAALVVQDSIRMSYLNTKASYTLADMVSREDEWIDTSYFNGLDSIFDYLVDERYPTDLRITTVECTANCTDQEERVLEVCWSKSSSGFSELRTSDIEEYAERTPLFSEGDTLLMTESFVDYTPLVFTSIFDSRRYEAIAFTRPRIAGQIKFDTGATDGSGNKVYKDCFNNDA